MEDIDIIVTWVDGADENWLNEKRKYQPSSSADDRNVRYRDWDTLRYWFRSIETNMPWIRKVHFVTWGHIPEWLNMENEKLNIVKHTDYIPTEYLPTFSSHPIELNMHRIEGLSEKFLYSNDDMFVLKKLSPDFWFKNDKPRDLALIGPYIFGFINSIEPIVCNDVDIINTTFNRKKAMKEKPFNWFNFRYGKNNVYNLAALLWPVFTGFQRSHYINPYLKSTFDQVWEKEFDVLDSTCKRKFRDKDDVNHWLMRYWQIASNNIYPRKIKKCGFIFTSDSEKKIDYTINSGKFALMCLNDKDEVTNFEEKKEMIHRIFEKAFPERSSFERF